MATQAQMAAAALLLQYTAPEELHELLGHDDKAILLQQKLEKEARRAQKSETRHMQGKPPKTHSARKGQNPRVKQPRPGF